MQPDAEYFTDFGFPIMNLPRDGEIVEDLDLSNTLKPLLKGSAALLSALALALHKSALGHAEASEAIALIEGQLDFALYAFTRWEQSPAKSKKEPRHDT